MIQIPTNDEEIIKLRKRQENSYLHDWFPFFLQQVEYNLKKQFLKFEINH